MKKAIIALTYLFSTCIFANACLDSVGNKIYITDKYNVIDLKNCNLQDDDMPVVSNILDDYNLIWTDIILDNNNISDEGAHYLKGSNFIVILINNNKIGSQGIIDLIGSHTEQVIAKNNQIDDVALEFIAKNNKIYALDVSNNHITSLGISAIAEDKRLMFLLLDGNRLTSNDAQQISNLSNLLLLSINDNPITDAGMAALSKNSNINELYARNTSLSAISSLYISKLKFLRKLDLSENNLGDLGAVTLARMPLQYIASLNLENNNIGDYGAMELANDIYNQDRSRLSSIELSLAHNNISDASVEALTKLVSIHHLSLDFNHISTYGITNLQHAFHAYPESISYEGNSINN